VSLWHLDFANDSGLAGFVRLADHGAHYWYWTYLVGVPDVPGIVVVRDHEVPPPRQGLEIRTEGLWAELFCETPDDHWTFGCEAFGIRLDEADDALRPGGEIGDRVAVGLDLEWEAPDIVHGEILVDRGRFAFDGLGAFYIDTEPPLVTGDVVQRVHIPEFGDRVLAATFNGLVWGRPR
jgi:hypothetical protein